MKFFTYNIIAILFLFVLSISCKKDEQSCHDGVFTPGKEEQKDCGGVCPPCDDGEDPGPQEMLFAFVDGENISFTNTDLTKSGDWVLNFQNDTISVTMNFGDGDSLGARPIQNTYSGAVYNGVVHSALAEGNVLFTEIDNNENRLSGFFECKFVSNQNSNDTLRVLNGDFENIPW